jgi:hypothetical protein
VWREEKSFTEGRIRLYKKEVRSERGEGLNAGSEQRE